MRTIFLTFAIATGTLLTGCEEPEQFYIYREGASVSRADRDFYECRLEAAQAVPQNTQVATTPRYTTPVNTQCYNTGYSVQCNTTGGQVYGGQTYSYDANSEIRGSYRARCLIERGYSGVSLPACDSSQISTDMMQQLSRTQRAPQPGACYVPLTNDVGNILLASEIQ